MPEELRIVVVDEGGVSAPASGGGRGGGGGARPSPGGVPTPPPKPPPGPGEREEARRKKEERGAAKVAREAARRESNFFRAVAISGGIGGKAATGNVAGAAAAGVGKGALAIGGPIGIAIAAVAAGLAVAGIAAVKFAQTIESQTAKLAGFSGPLAAAQAQTEITRELALLRRARRLGPALAGAERLRSRFEDKMTDLGTEILGILLKMLDAFEPTIDLLIKAMNLVAEFLEKHGDALGKAAALALKVMFPILLALEAIAVIVERFWGERKDEPVDDQFTRAFMDLLPRRGGRERDRNAPLFWPFADQPVPGV